MAKRLERADEIFLYCESDGRKEKEASMRTRFQQRFEQELERAAAALTKKGGTKKYPKVMERIGRLRERYPMTARFYKIEVTCKGERIPSHRPWKKSTKLTFGFRAAVICDPIGMILGKSD
jgi:hypothetical protein